jgi:Cof subfamily protein (haloacid dehalogenase superfamily)
VKYRMIAIDLDGTLLSPRGEITARTRAAVHRVLAAGMRVCFATGRSFTESKSVIDAAGHRDLAVFVGGAMVIDTRDMSVIHHQKMDPDLARELCAFLESRGYAALVLQDYSAAGVDYLASADIPLSRLTSEWFEMKKVSTKRRDDLAIYHHRHTIRIGVVNPSAHTPDLVRDMDEAFGSRIVRHNFVLGTHGLDLMEIFDPAVNKWQGILQVAAAHGIDPSTTIAVGDDTNDIPMIKNAGLGVAMGNAHPKLLAIAHQVIGHNAHDGLAVFLEDLANQSEPSGFAAGA